MGDYSQGSGQNIPLQDYAPDLPSDTPGILLDCNNAVPTTKGYKARNAPVQYGPALAGPVVGAYLAYYNDQSISLLAATSGQIYRLVGGAWTASGIAFGATGRVRFTQFNDDVIAVAPGISPIVAAGSSGNFAILAGSPPNNAVVPISVAGTVVMYQGANWYNSAFGNDISWTPDVQTLAGTGTLYDYPGPIVAAAPIFRAQVIFKKNAIWLGTFTGAPFVWNFQLISAETGTWGQECIVVLPDSIAFLGIDDFYVTTGYTPTRIPNNVRRYFFDNVDLNYIHLTSAWYDDVNATIYWHYISKDAVNQVHDRYVAYNLRVGKWATGYMTMSFAVPNTQPGMMSGIYFDQNNTPYTWTGTPTTMMLKTGYMGTPSRLSQLMRVRATYSAGQYPTSESMIPYHTYVLGQPDSTGPQAVMGADDWFNFRQYDRYHRMQLNTVGPAEVQSFAYEFRQGGTR